MRRHLLDQQWFTSTFMPAIPRPVRWRLRRLYFLPSDLLDRVAGRREALVPPKSTIFTGAVDDFRSSGDTLVHHLVDVGCLHPESRVLDIGCGMGRLAAALTPYLSRDGSYEGLDVVPSGIKWCTENIASKYPNFHFTLADVFNKEYNPGGRTKASAYRFPYADDTFDLVVLVSVFTHLLPADMEHYVAEISRVLVNGGCCWASYCLMNEESLDAMRLGQSRLRFKHHSGPCWTVDSKVPELAVGYDEDYVRGLFQRYGLSTGYTTHYGTWAKRPGAPSLDRLFSQDVVVTTKQLPG